MLIVAFEPELSRFTTDEDLHQRCGLEACGVVRRSSNRPILHLLAGPGEVLDDTDFKIGYDLNSVTLTHLAVLLVRAITTDPAM